MHNKTEKVSMVSLGCPKNLVDAEVMLGVLADKGYEITTEEKDADIIIVNTCSFIKEAREESVEVILDLADRKHDGRCHTLIVAGCLPQRYQEELAKELPEVDIFIGTGDYPKIAEVLAERSAEAGQIKYVGDPNYIFDETLPRLNSSPAWYAYLKIGEGCSNCCTYCAIPAIRGAYRSRPQEALLAEAEKLVAGGSRELILVSQDTTRYGSDLGEGVNLASLVKELAKIKDLRWIRLLYTYPDGIDDELIELLATEPKLCKYLDIPIQHISTAVLKRMNRRSTGEQIRNLVTRLREKVPGIALRTSLIVGFPGETVEDFTELLRFVEQTRFERLGVFCYSKEEGTKAAEMEDQISERVKRERHRKLMRMQSRVSFRINRGLVGTVEQVIVEGYSDETDLLLKGRTSRQAPDIDGQVYITSGRADVGDIVSCRITDSSDYDLVAEMLEEEEE
ncbi:MAG: 30S ribosomal protein S12 methylthiotransferase RimO [Trichlorobacter sp.]|nr:30S ribosomal protein S12 methylthiotransferase RimO [Trichlorobacter sp.]